MPELPEVHTTVTGLRPGLVGHTIQRAEVHDPRLFSNEKKLVGQKIRDVSRRGKWIMIDFEGLDETLIIHLRLTGSMILDDGTPDHKHDRAELTLEDGNILHFVDPRGFGTWVLVPHKDHEEFFKTRVGLEPIQDGYDGAYLAAKLKNRNVPIKTRILDQTVAAGIGNIYADEALFLSHLHPLVKSKDITQKEADTLAGHMKDVLLQGIENGGSSVRDYYRGDGTAGTNQDHLNVYGRKGKPCNVCGTPIERITVGGRGTHFCPHCQPEPAGEEKLDNDV